MIKKNIKSILIKFTVLLSLSIPSLAQNDVVDIVPQYTVAKNSITVKPQYALAGFYGLTYERYLGKKLSLTVYGEFSDGPQILVNNVYNLVKNSMDANNAKIYYTGYGGAIGMKRYFVDKKFTLVGEKDLNSLIGWYVGAYIPFRKMLVNLDVTSVETPGSFHAPQADKGKFRFDGYLYGIGFEAGRHWVWDAFSLDISTGFTYQNGIGYPGDFTFNRPGVFEYTVRQNAGFLGFYSTFAPKFEVALGVAF